MQAERGHPVGGPRPLILVVDDQPGVRRLVEEVFRQVGYRVASAANGRDALALVEAESPDLAVLDVKMPIMDGIATLRALRTRLPRLPVLMMTAVGEGEMVAQAQALGAIQTITKPFDVFALRRLAQSILEV